MKYIVDIYYTYNGLGEINNAYLYVQFSIDNGVRWSDVSTDSLKGDFGNNIMPGRRRVSWQPSSDLTDTSSEYPILCRLTLYDSDENKALGQNITGVLVWDVTKPEVAVRKLSLEEQEAMMESSSSSSSSYSSSSSSSSSSFSSSSSSIDSSSSSSSSLSSSSSSSSTS